MYCHCGRGFSFTEAHKESAPPDWQAREAWICDKCGKIHHAVQEVVVQVRGPKDARSLQHAVLHQNGQSTLTWSTPRGPVDTIEYRTYPRKVQVTDNQPLIYKSWILLMNKVEIILAPGDAIQDDERRTIAKHQARGIAEVLALLMAPFMESPDMVVKCAVKKYKDFTFEVPGLGEHLWDPTKNPDGSPRTPMPSAATKEKPKARPKVDNKSTRKLSAEETLGIRDAVGSGMFSKEDIASMFKVSMETLEEALRSA